MTLSNAPETGVPPVEGGIRVRRSCTVQHTPQILHRVPLSHAPEAYRMFRDKENGCVKVVLDPSA